VGRHRVQRFLALEQELRERLQDGGALLEVGGEQRLQPGVARVGDGGAEVDGVLVRGGDDAAVDGRGERLAGARAETLLALLDLLTGTSGLIERDKPKPAFLNPPGFPPWDRGRP